MLDCDGCRLLVNKRNREASLEVQLFCFFLIRITEGLWCLCRIGNCMQCGVGVLRFYKTEMGNIRDGRFHLHVSSL